MGKVGFLLHGALLACVVSALMIGSEGKAASIVQKTDPELARLEKAAAQSPTPSTVGDLATAYLQNNQPGLAQGLLDQHAALSSPELLHVRSRVALAQGQVDEALQLSRLTLATCDTASAQEGAACPSWLYARTVRQVDYLQALSSAGINDPAKAPAESNAIVERSHREVRLVAGL